MKSCLRNEMGGENGEIEVDDGELRVVLPRRVALSLPGRRITQRHFTISLQWKNHQLSSSIQT